MLYIYIYSIDNYKMSNSELRDVCIVDSSPSKVYLCSWNEQLFLESACKYYMQRSMQATCIYVRRLQRRIYACVNSVYQGPFFTVYLGHYVVLYV